MNPQVEDLLQKIKDMEEELEVQMALARAELQLRVHDGKIQFEQAILNRHREMKTRLWRYIIGARALILLSAPLIYMLIVPFVLLDVFITIYQAVCFPVYGIDKVRRRDFIIFDRRYLAYLNAIEKFNCGYCSYANGLIGYVREIASRTEQYWCPIKHARKVIGAHARYREFAEFGDASAYQDKLASLSDSVRRKKYP